MTFSVSILATGSELLDGRVVDTNSNFVARQLADLGLKVRRVLVVDDDMSELLEGLRVLSACSQLVITSGGLGPTTDDLTRECVARFFNVAVAESPAARAHLENFYAKRGRVLDHTNIKQALLPVGSEMIDNPIGTAPGFSMTGAGGGAHRVTVCSLSGVPKEFTAMFLDSVLPLIKQQAGTQTPVRRHTFKTFGVAESVVGALVVGCKLPDSITVSYRATFPEVHVVLKAPEGIDLQAPVESVRAALHAGVVFSEDPHQSLQQRVQELLLSHKATVATAESCTGGMVASYLTETPGASEVFLGAVVSYDNAIKERVLQVSHETLRQHGAVSHEVVREMASGVCAMMGTTYGIAISGVAGPGGGSSEKPVGTFHVGVCGPKRSFERRYLYSSSDRRAVRQYATYVALDLLRRELEGLEIPGSYPVLTPQIAPKAQAAKA
jgi:nicotinamide-nucleotide amidase